MNKSKKGERIKPYREEFYQLPRQNRYDKYVNQIEAEKYARSFWYRLFVKLAIKAEGNV